MGRVLVVVLLLCSGCALLANANAHHNSRGSACLSSPAFGIIDLAIAGGTAAAIGASDESAGYYAIPAVFGASGLLGVVSAARCAGDGEGEVTPQNAPPASNSAPSFGDAIVDPEARDATREELGLPPEPTAPPRLGLDRLMPTTLPPPPPASVDGDPKPPAPLACTLTPRKDCPDGYYCRLVAENAGECHPIP